MSVEVLHPETTQAEEARTNPFDGHGVLAKFAGPREVTQAARRARDAGYTHTDAFTPFPIHELDEALAIRSTILPWFVLGAGLAGGVGALAMQWWMNAVDYPYLISGKPLFSLPANIPVTFEVIILSAAFAAFFGMLALNKLPRLSNPLLSYEPFREATDDGFFLFIAADDPQFDQAAITELFQRAGASRIDVVPNLSGDGKLPAVIQGAAALGVALALIPPVIILWARQTNSELPRIHLFSDMDHQRSYKAQERSTLFADGRAMRPQVEGTIAVGDLQDDDGYFRGLRDDPADGGDVEIARLQQDPPAANANAEPDDSRYIDQIPIKVTDQLMQRGRMQFNVYCAPCHGLSGQGDGLVSLKAIEREESTWVPPSNLTNDVIVKQPAGKIYETISLGRRKMSGYEQQIKVEDRWAIVLYLRALQRSQNATLEDVPSREAEILDTQK